MLLLTVSRDLWPSQYLQPKQSNAEGMLAKQPFVFTYSHLEKVKLFRSSWRLSFCNETSVGFEQDEKQTTEAHFVVDWTAKS